MTTKGIKVVVEGDDDRVLVRALVPMLSPGVHVKLDPKKSGTPDGLAAAMQAARGQIGAGLAVLLVRDLDDLDAHAGLLNFARTSLATMTGLTVDRLAGTTNVVAGVATGENGPARFAIVGCGLPGIGSELAIELLTRFAVDDYALRLAHHEQVYPHIGDAPSLRQCRQALAACVEAIRREEIELATTKRLGLLLRAVANFRASPSEFLRRLLEVAIEQKVDLPSLLEPLRQDIDQALAHCLERPNDGADPAA